MHKKDNYLHIALYYFVGDKSCARIHAHFLYAQILGTIEPNNQHLYDRRHNNPHYCPALTPT